MRTWNERYLMGIPDLDQDHQRLFKICERIINRVREKGEDEATRMFLLREGVHFLQGYFAHHSAREEAYMLKIGYADYALHKSLHDDFNELLESRYEAMVKNGQCSHRDILDFVGTRIGWLLDHVATADMAIVGKGILREKAEERSGSYIIRQDVLEKELNHLFTATLNIEVPSIISTRSCSKTRDWRTAASTTCVIPLPRWPCRMGWMSKLSLGYWGTIPPALRWIPTPMSPRKCRRRRPKRWASSWK